LSEKVCGNLAVEDEAFHVHEDDMVVTQRVAEDEWVHLHNHKAAEELNWTPVVLKRDAEAQALVPARIC